jgi:hypothetical protein
VAGYPVSDSSSTSWGANQVSFQHGAILSSQGAGVHTILGDYYGKWSNASWLLHSPTTEVQDFSNLFCPKFPCTRIQSFELGAIIDLGDANHTYELEGPIFDRWNKISSSWVSNRPKSDPQNLDTGRIVELEDGSYIAQSYGATKAILVDSALGSCWFNRRGSVGMPTGEATFNSAANVTVSQNTEYGFVEHLTNGQTWSFDSLKGWFNCK